MNVHFEVLTTLPFLQLLIGGWQSFNLFFETPTYGWWLSTAAVGLHLSTGLHNVITWMKIRPFLTRRSSALFIGTLALAQPYWVLEIYATYAYFNNVNEWLFPRTRPIETAFRDPWWVAGCGKLLWVIKSHYNLSLKEVVTVSPRFAVMLACMAISIACVILDILSVTDVLADALPIGVNPFWKLALVFKCLTDTVILDDFKTALDRLWAFRRTSLAGPRAHDPVASADGYAGRGPGSSWKMSSRERGPPRRNTARDLDADLSSFRFPPGRARTPDITQYEMQPPVPARGVVVVTSTWQTAIEPAQDAKAAPSHMAIAES